MSSAAQRALRAGALLLLPCLGLALWLLRPGHPVTVAALLVCPGWGALRLLSVIDRRFGIAGVSLCLSLLLLGLATLLGSAAGLAPEQLGLAVQLGTVGLCLLGALRMALHRRWQSAQPPHPAPMPLWPVQTGWCLAVVAIALAAVVWACPPSRPSAMSPALFQAAAAESWLRVGEEPLRAGVPQPVTRVLACAAAALSAGSGLHAVRAVQLLSLCALAAVLLLCAESVARLRGNRGALAAMLAALLLLDPLGLFLDGLSGPTATTRLRVALWPFLGGDGRVVGLACAAMLLCTTLSVLRRSSFHVPRLAGVAAFGLALAEPGAALLLLPGWLLGIALAHLACRGSADNDPGPTNAVRRAGEPRVLRAPLWALVVPIAAGALGGLLLAGWPSLVPQPALPVVGRLTLALGVGALLYVPGLRWLNRGPGGEAWFFIGLLAVALPSVLLLGLPEERGGESMARLLALVLAVPAATGVLRLLEQPGRTLPVTLALLTVTGLSATAAAVYRERAAEHPLLAPAAVGPCSVEPDWIPPESATALLQLAERAPHDAVVVPPADSREHSGPVLALLAGRSLLNAPGASDADPGDSRAILADELSRGDTSLLLPLRSASGLATRELWTVHPGPCWPGFLEVARWEQAALFRAPVPDIVLVTVAGLRTDQLSESVLPRSAPLLARGLHFEQAFTPLPATLPALTSLLYGLAPAEHGVLSDTDRVATTAESLPAALARSGYRAIALVALESDGGLLSGFERGVRAPAATAGELVDHAIAALAEADRRPLCVWLHLNDLQSAGPPAVGRAAIDKALARLLASVPEHSLLALTAPWASAPSGPHVHPLAEAVIHVPLVVVGAGLPSAHSGLLTALQDLPALLLRGALPARERVYLAAPGDTASCGLRSLGWKTLLVPGETPATAPTAWRYDLGADPDELSPRPADADELGELLAWQGLAFK